MLKALVAAIALVAIAAHTPQAHAAAPPAPCTSVPASQYVSYISNGATQIGAIQPGVHAVYYRTAQGCFGPYTPVSKDTLLTDRCYSIRIGGGGFSVTRLYPSCPLLLRVDVLRYPSLGSVGSGKPVQGMSF